MIGDNIKQYRIKNDLTQEELGSKLNVQRAAVCNWEKNFRTPDINFLIKISEILNVSLDELCNNKNKYQKNILSEQQKIIMNLISDMSEEDLHDIEIYIRGYKSGKQNKNQFKFL